MFARDFLPQKYLVELYENVNNEISKSFRYIKKNINTKRDNTMRYLLEGSKYYHLLKNNPHFFKTRRMSFFFFFLDKNIFHQTFYMYFTSTVFL